MAKKNECAKELYNLINKKDIDGNYVYPEYEAQRELTQSDLNKLERQLRAMSDKIMKGDPSLTPAEARLKVFKVKMDDLNTLVENYKKRVQKNILTKNAIDVMLELQKYNPKAVMRKLFVGGGHEIDLKTGEGTGTKDDIKTSAEATASLFLKSFITDLEKINGTPDLMKQDTSAAVADQVMKGEFSDDRTGKLARIVAKHSARMVKFLRQSSVDINELEGRIAYQFHNAGKMLTPSGLSKEIRNLKGSGEYDAIVKNSKLKKFDSQFVARHMWKKFILPILDLARSFLDVDTNDPKAIDDALNEVWDHIINTQTTSLDKSITPRKSSLAMSIASKQRKLFIKDGTSYVNYQIKYGGGSLLDTIVADTMRNAMKIALIDRFGPDAEENFKYMTDKLQEAHKGTTAANKSIRDMKYMFQNASGKIYGMDHGKIGTFFKNIQVFNNLTNMGQTIYRVLTDMPNQYGLMRYGWGMGRIDALKTNIDSLMNAFGTSREQKDVLDLCHVVSKQFIGSSNAFGAKIDGLTGAMARLNNLQFTLNLLKFWDRGINNGAQIGLARHLSNFADKDLKSLPKAAQKTLMAYNYSPEEWDLWRQHQTQIEGHGKYLVPDAWSDMSDKEISGLTGAKTSDEIAEQRQKLLIKAISMFHDQYKYCVPGFDYLLDSHKKRIIASSPWGMAVNLLTQYKSYSVGFYNRVLMRAIRGSDTKGEMLAQLGQIVTGTAALGMIGMYAKAKMDNKPFTLDIFSDDPKERLRAGANIAKATLPAGGIAGDIIGAFASPHPSILDEMGPTISDANSILLYLNSLAQHTTNFMFDENRAFRKTALQQTEHLAKNHIPFSRNWMAVSVWNHFFSQQENQQ